MQRIIRTGSGRIELRTGSEGPKHDPYAYIELTLVKDAEHVVRTRGGEVVEDAVRPAKYTAHYGGLAHWCTMDGEFVKVDGEDVDTTFEQMTGFTTRQIERFIDKLDGRGCPSHGWRFAHDERGYPGETFTVCGECGHTISSSFNINAVI